LGSSARRLFWGASMLVVASGCQVVLGDFAVDDAKPVAAVLGDVCEPDAVRCTGERLETCSPDRQAWDLRELCASADQCDPGAAACRACTPGEWACSDSTLESCDATQHWQVQATCSSPELCSVKADRTAGSCGQLVCDPGAHRCDGNRLLRCTSGGEKLTLVERCASAELCDAASADAQATQAGRGGCLPPACGLGTFACDGATLERCRDDQTDWQPLATCADAASCNPLAGNCSSCTPGDQVCSGADLLRCGAAGFELVATCGAPELCDSGAGRCQPPECHAIGAVRCVTIKDLTSLEECGPDGRWTAREACETSALCSASAARCLAPACQLGATRCLGAVHQVCSEDLTRWVADQTCVSGQTCTPAGCEPAGCVEGDYRCNLASLERCVAGAWVAQNRCATAALCNVGTRQCDEPLCGDELGDFECKNQILRQCTPGREAWTEFLTCTGQRPVCDADPVTGTELPGCDACKPLAYSCVGLELHRCAADGSAAPRLAVCATSCTLAADGTPLCN
jgi:hypothetical protein